MLGDSGGRGWDKAAQKSLEPGLRVRARPAVLLRDGLLGF